MFIRKNTKIDVNIFDVSLMETTERKEIFDQTVQMHADSIESLKDSKMRTRLVVPAIYSQGNTRVTTSGGYSRNCLFYDILGIDQSVNRDCFGNTEIIKPFNRNVYNHKKRRVVRQEQMSSDDDSKVFIPESKAYALLHKHHNKELKASNKIIENTEVEPSNKSGYRYVMNLHPFIMEKQDYKFDVQSSIFKTISHVLFVDTVYTASEMRIALEQQDALFRASDSNTNYEPYFSLFDSYNNASTHLKTLYSKYDVKGPSTWKKDTENRWGLLEEGYQHHHVYNSLFDEDEIITKTTNDIFIPVTFVLFLENASHLFMDTQRIISEQHTIRNPKFFISNHSAHGILGWPEFIHGAQFITKTSVCRYKEQSQKLANISMDDYSLKTTLTIIPPEFGTRLIKSKLKSVNQFTVNKDCFYFFTDEDMERLVEQGKNNSNSFFCIRFDDRLDLSYYTHNINRWLINRFASEYYDDYFRLDDVIGFPKLLESFIKETLPTLYKELTDRQANLDHKFNSPSQTLISKEMFDYEKANLLSLYILRKSGFNLFTIRRENWSSDSVDTVLTPLRKNNYLFSRDIMTKFISCDIMYSQFGSERKAYLFETMFRLVQTLSNEELFTTVESIITECNLSRDLTLKNFLSRQTFGKEMVKLAKESTVREIRERFDKVIAKHKKAFYTPNHKMYYVLYDNDSLQLLPRLFNDALMLDYIYRLSSTFRVVTSFMKIYSENFVLVNGRLCNEEGLATMFLSDMTTIQKVYREYTQWYSTRAPEVKFVHGLLEANARAKVKIENLEEFINHLIAEFTKEYFSTTK